MTGHPIGTHGDVTVSLHSEDPAALLVEVGEAIDSAEVIVSAIADGDIDPVHSVGCMLFGVQRLLQMARSALISASQELTPGAM